MADRTPTPYPSRSPSGGHRTISDDVRRVEELVALFHAERARDAERLDDLRREVAASSTSTARVEAIAKQVLAGTTDATSAATNVATMAKHLTRATVVGSGGISAVMVLVFAWIFRAISHEWDASREREQAALERSEAVEKRSIENQRGIEAERAERLRIESQLDGMRTDLDKIAKAIESMSATSNPTAAHDQKRRK